MIQLEKNFKAIIMIVVVDLEIEEEEIVDKVEEEIADKAEANAVVEVAVAEATVTISREMQPIMMPTIPKRIHC